MRRHTLIWPLLVIVLAASSGWGASPAPPRFHPIRGRYSPAREASAAAVAASSGADSAPVGTSCAVRFPLTLAGWFDVKSVVNLMQTFRTVVYCRSWGEIKLCYDTEPGDPGRPECCDGYGPKDSVEEYDLD